jgi:hypothetical protein
MKQVNKIFVLNYVCSFCKMDFFEFWHAARARLSMKQTIFFLKQ